jgi:predicted nucleotidyltransferase
MRTRSAPVLTDGALSDICVANDIEYLGVFGSVARGDFDDQSDIDLLARFCKPKSLMDIVRIERQLTKRLGRSVDLVLEDAVSPYLKARILAEVRPVYEKP